MELTPTLTTTDHRDCKSWTMMDENENTKYWLVSSPGQSSHIQPNIKVSVLSGFCSVFLNHTHCFRFWSEIITSKPQNKRNRNNICIWDVWEMSLQKQIINCFPTVVQYWHIHTQLALCTCIFKLGGGNQHQRLHQKHVFTFFHTQITAVRWSLIIAAYVTSSHILSGDPRSQKPVGVQTKEPVGGSSVTVTPADTYSIVRRVVIASHERTVKRSTCLCCLV